MGHVQDRWHKTVIRNGEEVKIRTPLYGKGMRYKARYIKPDGTEGSKSFPDKQKRQAERYVSDKESQISKGAYIDETRGAIRFDAFVEEWRKGYSADSNTLKALKYRLKANIIPEFGTVPLVAIGPMAVSTWIKKMSDTGVALATQSLAFAFFTTIMSAAVEDDRIRKNPCDAQMVKRPKAPVSVAVPFPRESLADMSMALPKHYSEIPYVGAGTGARMGELAAFSPSDLSSDRQSIHVCRQVKLVDGALVFALPKGGKTRWVPLAKSVLARLETLTPVAITLPWEKPGGPLTTVLCYFTTKNRTPIRANHFTTGPWHGALDVVGLPHKSHGPHALRHLYATNQLEGGVGIKAVSVNLGHASPAFTLRVYAHVLPESSDRSRDTVDGLLTA